MAKWVHRFILLRDLKLQSRLMVYFVLLSVVPIYIVGMVTYQQAEKTIQKNASAYAILQLQQAVDTFDLYVESADSILQSLFFDRSLRRYVLDSRIDNYNKTVAMREVNNLFSGFLYPNRHIRHIYLVDLEDRIFASGGFIVTALTSEPWFDAFKNSDQWIAYIPTHNAANYNLSFDDPYDTVISVLRKYTNIERNEWLGVIGIDISYRHIYNIFNQPEVSSVAETQLITQSGEIVYHKDKNLVGTSLALTGYEGVFETDHGSYIETISGTDYFVVFTTSKKTGWKLIQQISTEQLFADARLIKTRTQWVGILCVLFAVLLAIGASYSVTAPIKKLRSAMAQVEKGDMNVEMAISSQDEIGDLSHGFNTMVGELETLIHQIYEDERIKKQIELNMLQQQINPHFLFNTLDSIQWMARMQNVPNIADTITALVRLLKVSTYTHQDFVTIEEEVENVNNYIAIQKFRYGSMFEVTYQIKEAIKNKYVLKLILQPLVENAINHGFKDRKAGGKIWIEGRIKDDYIELRVRDNGKGMDVAKIEKRMQGTIEEKNAYNSIGIYNTNKRLQLYYGEGYGLTFESDVSMGTTAIVRVPIREEEKEHLND